MALQAVFKKEVSETFLRCVKMGYNQDLAVIELNGLKIAEDRTFADCARHVFASILDLCLPPPPTCKAEYQNLYQSTVPDIHSQARALRTVMSCRTCRPACQNPLPHARQSTGPYFKALCQLLIVRQGHWAMFSPSANCESACNSTSQVRYLSQLSYGP